MDKVQRAVGVSAFIGVASVCGIMPSEDLSDVSALISAGASCAWISYQAENGKTSGAVLGPARKYGSPEAEAVGRRCVRLDSEGAYVEFVVKADADTMVMRYCIPDAPDGGGLDETLGLYINGTFVKRLALTSRYAWNYGDYPWTNDPHDGNPHHFFDEMHCFIPPVREGDVIRLQKDPDDRAEYYLIDFIELERVGAARKQPAGTLSITDFGAVPDDGKDDSKAMERCIASARRQGAAVWIPVGTFRMDGPRLHVGGVKVQGAGMWYSKLSGKTPMFEGVGEPVEFHDLAIFGEISHRDNQAPDNAFNGNLGDGSVFSRLWIEHLKCGFWTTHGTRNMTLRDSRIRNVMADGLNFCDGTSDSAVINCHLRNTGDDALASWSPTGEWSSKQPCVRNRFIGNTVEQPWLANGIALYGGTDHVIKDNEIRETVISGGGIHISSGFEAVPFAGTIRVENNRIVGAGGQCYIGETIGGIWLYAKDSDIDAEIMIDRLAVTDSAEAAVTFHGKRAINNVVLRHVVSGEKGNVAEHQVIDEQQGVEQ